VWARLRKKMAEWRHGVVQSWHYKVWRPTVWRIGRDGENNGKSSVYQHPKLAIATKTILAKVSIDSGLLPWSLLMMWRTWPQIVDGQAMDDSRPSIFREPWLLKKTSTSTTYLIGKSWLLKGHRDSRQGIKSTGIIKSLLWRKGRLVKDFRNFLYGR
jgi:hypothetical protein